MEATGTREPLAFAAGCPYQKLHTPARIDPATGGNVRQRTGEKRGVVVFAATGSSDSSSCSAHEGRDGRRYPWSVRWVSNWQFSRGFPDWATVRGARRLTYADLRMKNLLLSLLHLAVMTASCVAPVACEQ